MLTRIFLPEGYEIELNGIHMEIGPDREWDVYHGMVWIGSYKYWIQAIIAARKHNLKARE